MTTFDLHVSEAGAAKMLGVTKDTLAKWRRDGIGPRVSQMPILSRNSNCIRYKVSDLKTFAEQGRLPIATKKGRPRKDRIEKCTRLTISGPEKRCCRLNIALTPSSLRKLAAAAEGLGLTVSEYVRRAVGAE